MDHLGRQHRVRSAVEGVPADLLLVTRMTNIRYLTGFTGSLAVLLAGETNRMVVDGRYADQAATEAVGVELIVVDSSVLVWPTVLELVRNGRGARLAVEGDTLSASAHQELAGTRGDVVITRGLVERLRAVKDRDEAAELRHAVALTDRMLDQLVPRIRPGMTELELAGHIELLQFVQGGFGSASPIIACSGPRTALPHGLPTDRVVGHDEPVMVDVGTTSGGYGADTTRTFHIGTPPDDFRRIYDVVYEAQQAGVEAVKPGRTGREVDAAARHVIDAAGFGDRFGHALGHSIGLDYHEKPLLSPHDDTVLAPGMVLTVEPGVYIPGFGGVRIEDMVLVTDDGCDNLTNAPRELIEL